MYINNECIICTYNLDLDDKWHCSNCHQEIHEYCFNKHKDTNGNFCPFCRHNFNIVDSEFLLPVNETISEEIEVISSNYSENTLNKIIFFLSGGTFSSFIWYVTTKYTDCNKKDYY